MVVAVGILRNCAGSKCLAGFAKTTSIGCMKIVTSPWRTEFNRLISSAKKELRIVAPYYSEGPIEGILKSDGKTVKKYFVLALSERGVVGHTQSTSTIKRILDDKSSRLRFLTNLHAKFIVADKRTAIVTSSNLTGAGLESNVEVGVRVYDPKLVEELARHFDGLWLKAKPIDTASLEEYTGLIAAKKGGGGHGNVFGGHVKLGTLPEHPTAPDTPTLGWILVHSHKAYGKPGEYEDPQQELKKDFEPGLHWHWTLSRPLKEDDRPHTLLLAWEGFVFGKATATITRQIDREWRAHGRFAFVLSTYKKASKGPIPFSRLKLGNRERHHRSLIRLDEQILAAYEKLSH